jgi:hypothetical protein
MNHERAVLRLMASSHYHADRLGRVIGHMRRATGMAARWEIAQAAVRAGDVLEWQMPILSESAARMNGCAS